MKMLARYRGKRLLRAGQDLQYLPYLRENGFLRMSWEFPANDKGIPICIETQRYDCIFVQRKRFHSPSRTVQENAKRIIYDRDDAVMYKNSLAGTRIREQELTGVKDGQGK
jgi:hypothetical protein